MTNEITFPIQEGVRDLLSDLLGTGVAVGKASPLVFEEEDSKGVIGEFINDDGQSVVLCIADLKFACYVGAALSMIPAAAANESIKRNDLPQNLLENYSEVLNVMSRLVNSSTTPHLRLGKVHTVPGNLPEAILTVMESPSLRRDFVATISGYGSGNVSLLLV